MSDIKDVYIEFEECFTKLVAKIGFKKVRKKHYIRMIGQCIQHINILDTKIKGQQAINIRISVGVTYTEINKKVAELRMKKYDSGWATGAIDLGALSIPPENLTRYLTLESNVLILCEELFEKIESNASRFWDKTDSAEKMLVALLNDDKEVCSSTSGLWRPSWTSLAIVCVIDPTRINEVLKKYEDFFAKNMNNETRNSLKEKYSLEEM
ncbi:MAG: hypothetical protein K5900_05935 [Butyrivibrio sp.]|nr:hypothetical protein [Butyrivibrio sp.]